MFAVFCSSLMHGWCLLSEVGDEPGKKKRNWTPNLCVVLYMLHCVFFADQKNGLDQSWMMSEPLQ